MSKVKQFLTSDIVVRAVKTFVQAFVAVFVAAEQPFSTEVVVAAGAAAVSAVWNTVVPFVKSK